jgi:hypothetical protein
MDNLNIQALEADVRQAEKAALARTRAKTRLGRARAVLADMDYTLARAALEEAWRAANGVSPED